ncbi:hypothetical protein AFERRI_340014 [Acidithiobacillus ferrivorans]|uniref:Uncharacterized protein n=1 Tax=Acidithiobacillus ferrivorans TaxID=160808 RepID=A0A060UNJ8_9PROT|nr:hypothetical protein AFERRI_340014 [Acidithiobacillus ferrivorans]
MAHLVESMAFVRETPWHGLGNRLPDKQPLEVWLEAAGMDWEIKTTDVLFRIGTGNNFNVHSNPRCQGAVSFGYFGASVGGIPPLQGGAAQRDS